MTAKLDQETMTWTRFTDYVIEGGMIKPAPGATPVAYDPWAGYRAATVGFTKQPHGRGSRRGEAPYLRLMRLARTLEPFDPTNLGEFTVGDDAAGAILAFVRSTGLLGIFHHRVIKFGRSRGEAIWIQHGGQWIRGDASFEDDSVACIACPLFSATTPESVSFQKLAEAHFVAEMPHELPSPASVEFLARYGERLRDFVFTVGQFALTVRDAWDGSPEDLDALRVGVFDRTKVIVDRKQRVTGYEEEVVFPSLLHAFAAQATRDLRGGFRLLTCAGCGGLVRTNYHRTIYCHEQCRWKMVRRAQRTGAKRTGKKKEA